METLKRAWKNRYFRVIVDVALAFMLSLVFLFSLRLILGVEHPLLVVSSGSMMPTLNIGDIIVIQGVDPSQINVGDILVFRSPRDPSVLIVHRAIEIERDEYGKVIKVSTSGDAIGERDIFSPWSVSLLVGKVIMRVPYIGNIYLFIHQEGELGRWSFIIVLAIMIVLIALILFIDKENGEEEVRVKERKVGIRLAYIVAVDALLISFLIFSLWGFLVIWRPGAIQPREAIILGMYRDLELNEKKFGEAILQWGFMTYRIDCRIGDSIRLGVLTFSWFQLSLLILIIFNGHEIFNLLVRPYLRKK